MEKKYYIETYGCQMNVHDSEKMSGLLSGLGYTASANEFDADLVLINTCSVREKAAQKVFTRLGQLKTLKKGKPDLILGVCGCLAQQEGDRFLTGRPYVDLVFGPKNTGELPQLLQTIQNERRQLLALSGPRQEPTFEVETVLRESSIKAYITIMEGCDKFCTFCVVPFLRGREISRDPRSILEEARKLADQGFVEICLLGQNVNSYRHEGFDFADLLSSLHEIPGIQRIRYTSPHPSDINEKVMNLYGKLGKLCNHLHLPLQAGSNSVLARMKRDYTRETYLEKVEYLRKRLRTIALSTDIIVGFPGETREDFERTMEMIRDVQYASVFSFKYSQRPHTAALKMEDDVCEEEKSERLTRLQNLQREIQLKLNASLVGTVQEVLVEHGSKKDERVASGRTSCNRVVNFDAPALAAGSLVQVRIENAGPNSLAGVLYS
ncbi:MAG TPA: tRNA (N6-isopentenyl adenosine(37)-C2)-methylthiotransferase MiaB [Acidobacteriota bacterium]|nr:tRNA (N6-isopentenyl adenosine(37)-C2)-methylthiotransferase MiaB [Acidobacteriota bacterium]